MTSQQSKFFFIGNTTICPHETFSIHSLTQITPESITKTFIIDGYTIYTNPSMSKIWISEFNSSDTPPIDPITQSLTFSDELTYFNDNSIKIKQICGNINSRCIFFITNKNKLYAYGYNTNNILKLGESFNNTYTANITPQLIPNIKNVFDIKTTASCAIALCFVPTPNVKKLLKIWIETIDFEYIVPKVIIDLISLFANKTIPYSTTQELGSGQPQTLNDDANNINNGFHQIERLKDLEIIKIATGWRRTFFVDFNGGLWCCGRASSGKLGFSMDLLMVENIGIIPREIDYFKENGVKIKDVACGFGHNLALDFDGNMYSWGLNSCGQCGDGSLCDILEPVRIGCDEVMGKVVEIKCGFYHSYCRTINGRHFMWGSNNDFECVLDERYVNIPTEIDIYGEEIVDVFLGHFNTNILCGCF